MKKYLVIKNLRKQIRDNAILQNINLQVKKGEIVGIVGLNGSGKTTLLKCILGFVNYDGGIFIDGKNVLCNKLHNFGFIIENPNLYLHSSGWDNIKFWSKFYKNVDLKYVKSLCDSFNLDLRKKVKKYSLGMKQKLAIILSLINKPELLLLDEPTNGLDMKNIFLLRNVLLTLKDTTILISSHDINELCKICNRLIFINKGKIVKILDKSSFLVYSESELINFLESNYA